jgi:hypothetical protein
MMLSLFTLVALASANQTPENPSITVLTAVEDTTYWDRPVEVCGIVVPTAVSGTAVLYGLDHWLRVDTQEGPSLREYSLACVKGVLRRRDGLSAEIARERNLPRIYVSHGPWPDVVLRRCSDQASCLRLLPEER